MSAYTGKLRNEGHYILEEDGGAIGLFGGTDPANARRLVACWNAMLPFTTEQIEQNEAYLSDLIQERDALVKERDELVRVLRGLQREIDIEFGGAWFSKEAEAILAKYPAASFPSHTEVKPTGKLVEPWPEYPEAS